MDFNLTDEQNILKDSVTKFVADRYELESRRNYLQEGNGFSADNWQQFAELGWLSVPFSEELGGFGGSAVDLMVFMEELGKGLVVEPYLATVLLFGGALAEGNNKELQHSVIPQIIEGNVQGALAYHERNSRFSMHDVSTSAEKSDDGFVLNGEKTVVYNGMAADKIIVSARTTGNQRDEKGVSLFLVDANADGVTRTGYTMMDGQRVANVTLANVSVSADQLVSELDAGLDVLDALSTKALVALAAEAQGAMQVLYESTVEYSKTREQFSVPIGSFQVLQHRMVDMFGACELHRSLLYRTVCSIDEDDANKDALDVAKNIHALKTTVGRSGKQIGAEAIQIHGGMGMTDELAVGHYVKRLMMINTCLGDADYHQNRFAELARA
ncbi:MAG: acyl-CoA dehydrogenase family protein [Pseudomonadales bacterium]